jgi:hypothetical protein
LTGVGKTTRRDWQPLHLPIPVIGDFAAHVMSLQWVGSKPRDARNTNWTSHGTDGFLVRRMAKGELYPDHADSASLILMGDWCSEADTVSIEDLGCGKETVTDAFKTQKDFS